MYNNSKMSNNYNKYRKSLVVVLVALRLLVNGFICVLAAPTDGFTEVRLTANNFQLHKPYDVPPESRYSKIDGAFFVLEKFWVYSTDKPFRPDSPTKPRTEMRIAGHDYSSGVWQFEGSFLVPSGTEGACIFQVFGAATASTTLQLRVYGGNLWIYRNQIVASNIYDKSFKLNVIHDVANSRVTVFINGEQRAQVGGRGPSNFYFKYGVYAQDGSSNYMESRWSFVRLLKR